MSIVETAMKHPRVKRVLNLGLKSILGLAIGVVLFMIFYPVLPSLPFRVPPWVAARAKQRVPQLRPGMNEQEVWSTLGLSGWGFKARASGSGSPFSFPVTYVLWPGNELFMRWNYRTKPITLVSVGRPNAL
jgi:hypothetical protein